MTFRGRYNHVDEATLVLIGLKEMPSGGKIRVLDFAGGVLPFGAPTAHELYDQIAAAGQVPEILVIDKTLPEDLRPSYPDVKYSSSLNGVRGEAQIVRAIHVVEHMEKDEYRKVRKELLDKLANGGLFISLQQPCYIGGQGADIDLKPLPQVIKIMQKRDRLMVPVALLPDTQVPFVQSPLMPIDGSGRKSVIEEHLSGYAQFREGVKMGTEQINRSLDQSGYELTIKHVNRLPHQMLNGEDRQYSFDAIRENGWREDHDTLSELVANCQDAAEWFSKSMAPGPGNNFSIAT